RIFWAQRRNDCSMPRGNITPITLCSRERIRTIFILASRLRSFVWYRAMTNKMESGIGIRVLLIYAGVAFVPLAVCFLHPLDFPLHYPHGDMATTLWNFWWFDQTFWGGRNPYWCDILFYPKGAYLYLHTFEFVDALVTTPVRLLLGGVFA